MTRFFTKQRLATMASIALSLSFVAGCRSASYQSDSSAGERRYGSLPFYQPYPKPPEPYNDELKEPPESQPILPVPGFSDPEVPPAPSAQRSKKGLTPSNFKFPSLNRQANEVHQMTARTGERLSALKNRISRSTSREESNEVVAPTQLPELKTTPDAITDIAASQEAGDDSPTIAYPRASRNRPRSSMMNRRLPTRVPETDNEDDSDVPKLTPPITTNPNVTPANPPRLLPPNA